MFIYTVFCQAAKLRVSGLKHEAYCSNLHYILMFSALDPNTFSLCNYEFCLFFLVFLYLSNLLSRNNWNSTLLQFTSFYLKFCLKCIFSINYLCRRRFNLLNSLIFAICVLGPILYQFNSISLSVVYFPLPTIYQGSLEHTFPLYW